MVPRGASQEDVLGTHGKIIVSKSKSTKKTPYNTHCSSPLLKEVTTYPSSTTHSLSRWHVPQSTIPHHTTPQHTTPHTHLPHEPPTLPQQAAVLQPAGQVQHAGAPGSLAVRLGEGWRGGGGDEVQGVKEVNEVQGVKW